MKSKKKAFTLTELLVVVIVIGVLSAVVLPKFSKVIETRKTTEAEELMSSIRTEQEKRCALDKEYLVKFDGLQEIVKSNNTKNYELTLVSTGINARRKDEKYKYMLQMPSYADGRICCDDEACKNLNKNYPTCSELRTKTDYQVSPANCAGKIEEPVTPPTPCEEDPTSCECNSKQAKCCPEGTTWNGTSCVTPPPPPAPCNDCTCPAYAAAHPTLCGGSKPCLTEAKTQQLCTSSNACGYETRSASCDTTTGTWQYGEWDKSGCNTNKPYIPSTSKCNTCGEKTLSLTCEASSSSWKVDAGECSVPETAPCNNCPAGTTWDGTKCASNPSESEWLWQEKGTYEDTCLIDGTMGFLGTKDCKYDCANFKGFPHKKCDSAIKVGQGCVENTPVGGYHGSSGESCVVCKEVAPKPLSGAQCPKGHECTTRTVSWTIITCLPR